MADLPELAFAVLDLPTIERRTAEAFDRYARAVDRREAIKANHPAGKSDGRSREATRPSTNWRDLAACKNVDGDWVEVPRLGIAKQRTAKQRELAFCGVCPVRVKCLEAAMPYGIWGGTLPKERRQ